MNSKITNIALISILSLITIAGVIMYPMLPDKIASHWNATGEANGYMGKFWGIFLLPLVMAGMFIIYFLIPKIDPLKNNILSFRSAYNTFWAWMFVFMAYIFGLSMAWNLGHRFNFTVAIVPAMAILFYIIGGVLEKSKRNWFVGIRTPWTLSSDIVWDKTHKLGGKLFKIAAIISLLGIFLPDPYIIGTMVFPIIIVTIITIIYSYIEYRKQNAST